MAINPLLDAAWEEEEYDLDPSLLERLGSVGLSGVAATGNALDLLGSSVRDLLAFENPADQWLTPFSGENRTSGRDLLRKYGLASQTDTYANFFGGMAVEVGLDPFLWTGAGSLLTGAKVGASVGSKGLLRVGIPFTTAGKEILTGARAAKVAAGIRGAGELALKPSKLAPELEKAAKAFSSGTASLTARLPGPLAKFMPQARQAAPEAAEEVAPGILAWTVPQAIDETTKLKTTATEALEKEFQELDDWIREADLDHADYTSKEVRSQLVKRELERRKQGGKTLSLDDLIADAGKSEIQRIDMPPGAANPILDAAKQIPAQWAETTADILTLPARFTAMLLHAPYMGELSEAGQQFGKERHGLIGDAYQKVREEALSFVAAQDEIDTAVAQTFGVDLANTLPEHLSKSIANVDSKIKGISHRLVRFVAETGGDAKAGMEFFELDPTKATPELLEKITKIGNQFQAAQKKTYDLYRQMGGAGNDLTGIEGFEHLHRMGADRPDDLLRAFKLLTKPGGAMAREAVLRTVPQEVIERVSKRVQDIDWNKAKPDELLDEIGQEYGEFLGKDTRYSQIIDEAGEAIARPREEAVRMHTEELLDWAKNSDGHATYAIDNLLTNNRYLTTMRVSMANLAAIHKTVLDNMAWGRLDPAVTLPKGLAQLRGKLDLTQPLAAAQPAELIGDLYAKAGLDPDKALGWLAESLGASGDEIAEHVAALKDLAVPKPIADAILASRRMGTQPQWREGLLQLIDIPTRWFKENVTLPFVSFATRNLTSGQLINALHLESFDDFKLYGKHFTEAFEAWRKGEIPEAAEAEWFSKGVLSGEHMFEGVPTRSNRVGHVAPPAFELGRAWGDAGLGIEPSFLDKVPGLRTVRQAQGAVLKTGSKVNRLVEYLARVPMYETLKAKGWSPEAAAKKVAELQVDYTPHNFTPFENEVMRRLVPFWAWQRKVAPVILGHLAKHPAGALGQTIRATRLSTSNDPGLPDWLSETLAIENPLGSQEPGGKSYITGLGLPHEPILSYASGGGMQFLSQLNPLIKAPLELATGMSFFQDGRPLDDLNPPIGQTLANVARFAGRDPSEPVPTPQLLEHAVANSPLSRYVSTARTVTDSRKHPLSLAANLLTGVRVSDVSPGAMDASLSRKADELFRELGGREFTRAYLKDREHLSEADQALANQLDELRKLIDRRKRSRREAEMAMAQ